MVGVGDIFQSNSCGKYQVIKADSFRSIHVRFLDTGYECQARCDCVVSGAVKDKLFRSVHGIGYIGVGEFITSVGGKNNKAYTTWQRMIGRCYDKNNASAKYYDGCTVATEWHNFQNFANWFYENLPEGSDEIHLDKDIKVKGNRVYSPESCTLVTLKENIVQAKAKSFKAKSPNGETHEIYNLAEFCRANGLNKANMHKVVTGKNKSCKGWTAA